MTVPRLESDRLLLRPLAIGDAEGLWRIFQDPDFTRYTAEPPKSLEEMRANVHKRLSTPKPPGMGSWVWIDRETGELIGRGGLFPSLLPDRRIEMGWFLAKERWGTGLAGEAARAIIAHAFETLSLPEVWALVLPANAASKNLALRLGFVDRGTEVQYDQKYTAFRLDNER